MVLPCAGILTALESGLVTADMTTTVVLNIKLHSVVCYIKIDC